MEKKCYQAASGIQNKSAPSDRGAQCCLRDYTILKQNTNDNSMLSLTAKLYSSEQQLARQSSMSVNCAD